MTEDGGAFANTAQPLVSVVTAAFNALEGVKTTVGSVAEQSFRSVEHIVIDGGSTDGTPEYLESLGETVRWISEPDRGIADALNKGVAMARGQYILVLQAEDHFHDASSLARAEPYLRNGADIVGFDILYQRKAGSDRRRSRGFGPRTRLHPPFYHQGLFCRTSLFKRLGFFDDMLTIAMDYDFCMRAYVADVSATIVPKILSVMPDTGVSSLLEWKALKRRLQENRIIHFRYADRASLRLFYRLYWLLYPPFKRMRSAIVR